MKPKIIGKGEKRIMYAIFGAVDAAQLIFVETVIAGTIIDIFAGIVVLLYGLFRKLWTGKKILILLATFIGEFIPFVNAFPFWVLDIKNLYSGTITPEEAEQQEILENFQLPANTIDKNGNSVRLPSGNSGEQSSQESSSGHIAPAPSPSPKVVDGIRAASR
jgi:hypothetical protein